MRIMVLIRICEGQKYFLALATDVVFAIPNHWLCPPRGSNSTRFRQHRDVALGRQMDRGSNTSANLRGCLKIRPQCQNTKRHLPSFPGFDVDQTTDTLGLIYIRGHISAQPKANRMPTVARPRSARLKWRKKARPPIASCSSLNLQIRNFLSA